MASQAMIVAGMIQVHASIDLVDFLFRIHRGTGHCPGTSFAGSAQHIARLVVSSCTCSIIIIHASNLTADLA